MIKDRRFPVDGAIRDLNVMRDDERPAARTSPKGLGCFFEGVVASSAVSDLYRPTEDGHICSVSYPTTVGAR